jgi:hypothetical protein
MLEKYEQACAILHGFDYQGAAEATAAKRMPLIAEAVEHVLQQKDGKPRFYDALEVNDSAVKVLGEPTLKTISANRPKLKSASLYAAFSANTVILPINRKRQRKRYWNRLSCSARNGWDERYSASQRNGR